MESCEVVSMGDSQDKILTDNVIDLQEPVGKWCGNHIVLTNFLFILQMKSFHLVLFGTLLFQTSQMRTACFVLFGYGLHSQ